MKIVYDKAGLQVGDVCCCKDYHSNAVWVITKIKENNIGLAHTQLDIKPLKFRNLKEDTYQRADLYTLKGGWRVLKNILVINLPED
jgi:hypothetical protein